MWGWEGREQGEKKERAFQAAKGRPLGQEGIIPGSHELQSPEETDQGRAVRGCRRESFLHFYSIPSQSCRYFMKSMYHSYNF